MRKNARPGAGRRGMMLVVVSLFLILLIGMLALAIDLGCIACARVQLQSSADAAALAAPPVLFDRGELKGTPSQAAEIAQARAQAQLFGGMQPVIGTLPALDANPGNALGGDLVMGYLPSPSTNSSPSDLVFNAASPVALSPPLLYMPSIINPYLPFVTPPAISGISYNSYNAAQVIVHRDATRNGPLILFFGGAIGPASQGLSAMATACYEDNVIGFQIASSSDPYRPGPAKLLPFAMDVNTFGNVAAGNSSLDLYKYNPGLAPTGADYSRRVTLADPSAASLLSNSGSALSLLLDPRSYSFNASTLNVHAPLDATLAALVPGDQVKEALLVPLVVPQVNLANLPTLGLVSLPSTSASVGNFGSIYVGTLAQGNVNEFARQVRYGVSKSDLDSIGGSLKLGPDGTLALPGDSGLDVALKTTLQQIQGQPRIIALYSSATTPGSAPFPLSGATNYTIVGFAGVVVVGVLDIPPTAAIPAIPDLVDPLTGRVLLKGTPAIAAAPASLKLMIQPEFVVDGTAMGGGWSISRRTGARTSRFVYRPLALSR